MLLSRRLSKQAMSRQPYKPSLKNKAIAHQLARPSTSLMNLFTQERVDGVWALNASSVGYLVDQLVIDTSYSVVNRGNWLRRTSCGNLFLYFISELLLHFFPGPLFLSTASPFLSLELSSSFFACLLILLIILSWFECDFTVDASWLEWSRE